MASIFSSCFLFLFSFILINNPINQPSISGIVTIPSASTEMVKRSPYGKPSAVKTNDASHKKIVVWLEQANDFPVQQGAIATLNQKDIQFDPRLLVIHQGEKIRVTNSDAVYHNVFSLSSVKKVDIGRRLKDQSVDVSFEKAGVVKFFCDIHSHMNAEVIVLSKKTRVWKIANDNGMFEFDNIPNGEYKLHCYASGFKEYSMPISINSESVKLNIKLEK